jgi:hypothetical protein
VSERVYIHELIDIVGHNRARYMHHMTANWVPVALAERNQRCFGVWATVGSTGRWPEVVNMWELDSWDGLVRNFEVEFAGGRTQDPSLADWWSVAASLRRGGTDRIVVDLRPEQLGIKAAAGDFSGAPGACGIGAPIDTTKHVVFSKKLRLDALTSVREHSINVPSRVGVLRIAMNGSDDGEGSNDFDLHVYQGSKRICAEDGSGQFGFCEVKQPAAGVYKIRVSRKKGAGDIQVTVSVLPNDR